MILIVTNKEDITADFFITKADAYGLDYFRLNTEDFPTLVTVVARLESRGAWEGYISDEYKSVSLSEITGVWYRRPRPSQISDEVSGTGIREFSSRESTVALDGILKTLNCNWVSHPDRIRAAESKILQLREAVAMGFSVPRTIVANSREELVTFAREANKATIIKTISGGRISDCNEEYLIYTNIIDLDHEQCKGAEYAANLVQEFVKSEADLRVSVFGDQVIAAEITRKGNRIGNDIDWRRHQDAVNYRIIKLPEDLKSRCVGIVKRFGLSFSALDFIVTPDDDYYFLEMNPNGQWAWIEEATGEALSEALIKVLCAERN